MFGKKHNLHPPITISSHSGICLDTRTIENIDTSLDFDIITDDGIRFVLPCINVSIEFCKKCKFFLILVQYRPKG